MKGSYLAPGLTLLELLIVLSILGVLLGVAYSPLRRGLDTIATRGARDTLGIGVAHARSTAISKGGATLIVDLSTGDLWIEGVRGDTVGEIISLNSRYGVRVAIDGSDTKEVRLRFDALGIGRVTNRTFQISRGRAVSHLSLSSYGRPRSW